MDYNTVKDMLTPEQFDAIQNMMATALAIEEDKKQKYLELRDAPVRQNTNVILRQMSGASVTARRLTNAEMTKSRTATRQIITFINNGDAGKKRTVKKKGGKSKKMKGKGKRRNKGNFPLQTRVRNSNRRMKYVKSLSGLVGQYISTRLHVKDTTAIAQRIVDDSHYGLDHVEIAQTIFQEVICEAIPDNWMNAAATWALLAFSQNSHVNDVVIINSIPVGVIYLSYVTLLWDLHNASNDMISVLDEYPEAYIKLRTSVRPKTVKDRNFSWGWPTVQSVKWEDFEHVLNSGAINMVTPGGVSLSWPTGAFTATGEPILETTVPVLTILDLQQVGAQWVNRIFRIVQVDADKYPLVTYKVHEPSQHSTAAFAFVQSGQNDDLLQPADINCEVPWPSHCTDIALLTLARYDAAQREAGRAFRGLPGVATFAYKNDNPYFINEACVVSPGELSYAMFQMMYTGILVAADLAYQRVVSRNTITQSATDSVLKMCSAGQWMHYCLAFFSKKYARCSAYIAGQGALFSGSKVMFAGAQWTTFWDISAGSFFSFINDCCAELQSFPVPASANSYLEGYQEIIVPYFASHGFKTNVNPIEVIPGNDCNSLLQTMYPNSTIVGPYDFLPALLGSYDDVFDRTSQIIQFLTGQVFDEAVSAVAGVFNLLQATAAEEDLGGFSGMTTLMYVTCIVSEPDPQTAWDNTANLVRLEVSSRHPFDPNGLSVLYNPAKICYTKYSGGEYKNWFSEMTQLKIQNSTTVAQGFCQTCTRQAVDPYSTHSYAEQAGGGRHESRMSVGGSIIDFVKTVGGGLLRTVVGSIFPKFFGNIVRGGYIPPTYFTDHEDPKVLRHIQAAKRLMFEEDVPSMRPITGASSYNGRGGIRAHDDGSYLFG